MRYHRLVRPLIAGLIIAGAAAAGVLTRETWLPFVIPPAKSDKDKEKHEHEETPHDRVKLSTQAQENLGLNAGTLSPQEYWRKIVIPGVVVERPGESDRGVASRVTGIVTEIAAKPGETVKPGSVLFKLELVSEYLQAAQIELAKSATDLALATKERDRIGNLVKLGTAPGAELMRAQSQVDRLTNQAKSLRRQLQLFGLSAAQVASAEAGDVVTEVTVTAPNSDGNDVLFEVKDLKVRLGQQVQSGQALCTLADHRRLFVEGWAFKTEAKTLAVAAEKQIRIEVEFADESPGDWDKLGPLVVHHLANEVDPVNRTFPFYLSIDNESRTLMRDGKTFLAWRFRPGQRVRLRLPVERLATKRANGTLADPFVLPAGAVTREGAEAFVFVQAGDVYIRKPVRVLYEDRADVVIANDGNISRAEMIVKNQAAALNRAIKAAAGGHEGHSHEH